MSPAQPHDSLAQALEDADRYRRVIDAVQDAIYSVGPSGRLTSLNAGFETITGWPRARWIGQPFAGLVHPDDLTTVLQRFARVMGGQSPPTLEVRVLRADGDYSTVELSVTPQYDPQTRHVCGLLGVARDVTRQKAESAARARLAAIVENSSDAIIGQTLDGTIVSWNAAAERTFGYAASEIVGQPFYSLCFPQHLPEAQRALEAVRGGRRVEPHETDRLRKDGRPVRVSLSISPIRDPSGEIIGVSTIARDITDRIRAEETLRFQNALLESQSETSIDGILVVAPNGRIISFNRRFADLWGIPDDVIATRSDDAARRAVVEKLADPDGFRARVDYLMAHPDESSRDTVRLKDGRTFDRYTAPLRGGPETSFGRVWYFRDVTDQIQAQEALRQSETRYRLVSKATNDVIWDWDPVTDSLFWNDGIETVLRYAPASIPPGTDFWKENIHPDDRRRVLDAFSAVIGGSGESWSAEYRFRRGDGSYATVFDRGYIGRDAAGKPVRMIGALQDVTAQRDRERQLAYRDAMLQALSEATRQFLVCEDLPSAVEYALATLGRVIDADRVYVSENQTEDGTGRLLTSRRHEWCGPAATPLIGDPNFQRAPCDRPAERWRDELSAGRSVAGRADEMTEGERQFLADQGVRSTLVVPIMIRGEWWGQIGFDDCRLGRHWGEGEVSILTALAASVGGAFAREQSEAKLEHDSLHDGLTGLPNRVLFHDRVERCIRRTCADPDYRFAVLFLDLDRFKVINDSLGHAAGDALLTTVADRLRACLRGADGQPRNEAVVARLGGDEFTALLGDLGDPADANRVADRILAEVGRPIEFDGHEITTTPSIGLVVGGPEYTSAKDVLRDADAAMYKAKTSGKNQCAVFDATLHAAAVDRLRLESDLRHALARGELLLHYQPVFSLESRQLLAFEALVRWRHDDRLLAPEEFLPIAEDTGLIVPIGRWVLEQACRQLAAWRAAHPIARPVTLSVNVARRQLADASLVPHLVRALADARLDPAALKLEVTESVIMDDGDAARKVLAAVKRTGVGVSMDDFGTGHSSLGCLHKFPLDELKIDRSFVQNLQGRRDAAAVVQAIVTLAQNLGMKVVAEGVERTEQLAFLQAVGCDAAQGFLFAKPLPPDEAERLLITATPPTLPAAA